MVKVSEHGRHVMSSSPVPLKTHRIGQRCTLNLSRAETSSRWCGVIDYFLWGYVKSFVYADKPQTLDHLEDNIRRVIADIRPQMLEKVIENWMSRLEYNRASCGSPMPEII
ncbi:hypothetical protein TNCV_4990461 [Trichonephila clavipes]|nr:hypothetical protein TNCV_4990461 [Trichonephila clavipes]